MPPTDYENPRGAYSGQPIRIGRRLGGGTQGEVFKVRFGDAAYALKWFRPEYLPRDPDLRSRIDRLIHCGAPSPAFLWPLDLAVQRGADGFGYVMPLMDRRFHRMRALLERRLDPSFEVLCRMAMALATAFLRLHGEGLCYRDINFENVAFDPLTGEVAVVDNDNVDVDGSLGAIVGTPLFMAPEVLRREAQPSSGTDLHSLAVLLFYIFCGHHPFEGARELQPEFVGPDNQVRLYTDPIFIFDSDVRSNAPDPALHATPLALWSLYPGFFKALFRRAFGPGRSDPLARVQESEWRRAAARLRDAISACERCGAESFYDARRLTEPHAVWRCWSCASTMAIPPRLRMHGETVVLGRGRQVFPHHLDPSRECDFSSPVARTDGARRLQNLSPETWVVRWEGGTEERVAPGEAFEVTAPGWVSLGGTKAQFRP